MKVALLSTSDLNGGAAVSSYRIHEAFHQNGLYSSLIVQDKRGQFDRTYNVADGFIGKQLATFRYGLEKLSFLPFERDKSIRFQYSLANTGLDLSRHPLIKEADIIQLNWIHQGFLSMNSIEKLIATGKPVFWVLHDMWSFTGGCHYAGDCTSFHRNCGNCRYMRRPHENDLSRQLWNKKAKIYDNAGITVVASSNWLAGEARKSSLFSQFDIHDIPTPINSNTYHPEDKRKSKLAFNLDPDKKYLLFGAMSLGDERKGFRYLREATKILDAKYPELKNEVELIMFGKADPSHIEGMPFKSTFMGRLSTTEQLLAAYNAAEIFILPTLEDNLPNTIIEAIACAVPVVAFNCTGVPEIVDHLQNGYLAQLRSANDIATGIEWILKHDNYTALAESARTKALTKFAGKAITAQFRDLYNKKLAR